MDTIIKLCKALSDETRLKILLILSRRRICAKGIAKHLSISEAAVSQHLKVLKETGLITGEKSGYYMKYTLVPDALTPLLTFVSAIGTNTPLPFTELDFDFSCHSQASCKAKQHKCCDKFKNGDD